MNNLIRRLREASKSANCDPHLYTETANAIQNLLVQLERQSLQIAEHSTKLAGVTGMEVTQLRSVFDVTASLELSNEELSEANAFLATENQRIKRIAWLIGSIFAHGDFEAETRNERELEELLKENGTFWTTVQDFDRANKEKEG